MTTGTGSARYTSTRWRGSGPCCGLGSDRIGGCRRRNCRCTWGSSSSCTTSGGGARPSLEPWSGCSSGHLPETPDEPRFIRVLRPGGLLSYSLAVPQLAGLDDQVFIPEGMACHRFHPEPVLHLSSRELVPHCSENAIFGLHGRFLIGDARVPINDGDHRVLKFSG